MSGSELYGYPHSWASHSLGVKVNAYPGQLNQQALIKRYPGVSYGQCSEICGPTRRLLLIVIQLIPDRAYFWRGLRQLNHGEEKKTRIRTRNVTATL